jgi:hypothetical protein
MSGSETFLAPPVPYVVVAWQCPMTGWWRALSADEPGLALGAKSRAELERLVSRAAAVLAPLSEVFLLTVTEPGKRLA